MNTTKYVAYVIGTDEGFALMVSEDRTDRASVCLGIFNSPHDAREYIERRRGKENVRWLKD